MGATKRQHFIPRLYLKRFASGDGLLRVYDKLDGRRFERPVHIMAVAQSTSFYDFPVEMHEEILAGIERGELPEADDELVAKAKDPQMIEHYLRDIEGHYASALRLLLEAIDMKARIAPAHRQIIAHFLLVQRMRTPNFRERLLHDWRAAAAGETMLVSGEPRTFSLPPINEKLERVVHANAFTSPAVLGPAVEQLIGEVWRIGVNGTSRQLYTSDDPVIVPDTLGERARTFPLQGARLLFPLTPERLLVIFKQGTMPESIPMSLGEFALTDEQVAGANRLQVMNCSRQVYCRDDQFNLAESVVKELLQVSREM